jgi:hypothetical protein
MAKSAAPTLHDAEAAIRARFKADGAGIELRYDETQIVETDRWWYFPCSWLGCKGLIVDKRDLYVNWLGSGLCLDDCFWGHDRGLVHDAVDFTFTDEIDANVLTIRSLVGRFQHYVPRRSNPAEEFLAWYLEPEIDGAITRQYPTFRRHFVWSAIPDLRKAVEARAVSFVARRNEGV